MTRRIIALIKVVMSAVAVFVVYAAFRPTNQQLLPAGESFPMHSVSGRVATSTGAPPSDMVIWAYFKRGSSAGGFQTPVRADGTFTVTRLEAGRWILVTGRAGEHNAASRPIEGGFEVVDVEDHDLLFVVISTAPTVDVPARIRYEPIGQTQQPQQVVVHAQLDVSGFGRGPIISAVPQPDGSLMFYDLFGPRVIEYGISYGNSGQRWQPTAVLLNGKDVMGQPVNFSSIQAPRLEVVLFATGGQQPR